MKLLIVTDTWEPQINGVVRTLKELIPRIEARGVNVSIIDPGEFYSMRAPFFAPDVRLALPPYDRVRKAIKTLRPDTVHIATEGPLGWKARAYCLSHGLPFTTWYHSNFALYASARVGTLKRTAQAYLRNFHAAAEHTFVSNESLRHTLAAAGYANLVVVPLGVDVDTFIRRNDSAAPAYASPVFLFFGRLAPEKSPEEFFALDLPGTKLVIGDGPSRAALERKYGATHVFLGNKTGRELVDVLSRADVLIFPSRTETFGLTALEALACGVPVVAHDVMGPRDIITDGLDGYLTEDLGEGALKALTLSRDACRAKTVRFDWEKSADAFVAAIRRHSYERACAIL